ncbi:NAD(P)-binding protein [Annulohypoxylon maeteangense]|uniref:NAD(P)-binding protein n=1 Tax=Annulohypoxylon maeteangense TaxID=1927788 RepID=UPI002007F003|nr:NAD(P)-binding protein [Annulohypoxylon maeteangense]KAI0885485.1 NAD(P)-binding protein [Annulohypoxylon maeteangense]
MSSSYNEATTADELVRDFAAEIKGKVILTTGVSPNSLGSTFVESLAEAEPALLILAGRKIEKVQQTADAISLAHPKVKTRILQLDLGSFDAIREAAATVNGWEDVPYIDVLVNNAGIMAVEFALSPDGFESQFATNHLGHFLFTNLIMNKILASKTPRIVSVSSDGHRLSAIRWGDYNWRNGETYNKWCAYGQSKTANMLMAISIAEKLGPRVLAYSLHPGVISTNLGSHIDWATDYANLRKADQELGNKEGWSAFKPKSTQAGAATHVFAAFSPSLKDYNGAYLQDCQVADPWVHTVKPWATSSIEAEKLWKLSEKLVGQEFTYAPS